MKIRIGIAGLCYCLLSTAQTVVSEAKQPEIWTRTFVVPTDMFTFAHLEERFRQTVAENTGKSKILDFYVYLSRESAISGCKCRTEINYQTWQMQFEDYQIAPVAELLAIGNSAAMRVRNPSGKIEKKVLKGDDPFFIKTETCSAEILYVYPNSFPRRPTPEDTRVTFFTRSAGVREKACVQSVTKSLVNIVETPNIRVFMRSDPWFINDEDFPIAYSFETTLAPPTEAEFNTLQESSCHSTTSDLRCGVSGQN